MTFPFTLIVPGNALSHWIVYSFATLPLISGVPSLVSVVLSVLLKLPWLAPMTGMTTEEIMRTATTTAMTVTAILFMCQFLSLNVLLVTLVLNVNGKDLWEQTSQIEVRIGDDRGNGLYSCQYPDPYQHLYTTAYADGDETDVERDDYEQ